MTVLIKGMEMPDNCEKCPFLDYEQGFCFASGRKGKGGWYDVCLYSGSREFNTVRNPKCPLVEVPTPHGRLIDAGALLERFEKEEKAADEHGRDFSFSFKSGGENCTEWWPVQQILMDAPTVIEAEK